MIFGPNPPPTNGAMTRTCDSSKPSIAREPVPDRDRRLRGVPDRQLFGAGVPLDGDARFSIAAPTPRSYRNRRSMTTSARSRARRRSRPCAAPRAPRHLTSRSRMHERRAAARAQPRGRQRHRADRCRRRRPRTRLRRRSGSRRRPSRSARRHSGPSPARAAAACRRGRRGRNRRRMHEQRPGCQ